MSLPVLVWLVRGVYGATKGGVQAYKNHQEWAAAVVEGRLLEEGPIPGIRVVGNKSIRFQRGGRKTVQCDVMGSNGLVATVKTYQVGEGLVVCPED